MMITCVADVHLGNHKRFGGAVVGSLNERCSATLEVFRAAAARAVQREASIFIVAGDLFDYSRPEAPLIAEVQQILKHLADSDVRPILLVGNHDQVSNVNGDHALAPLAEFASIVEQPSMHCIEGVEVLCVPFQAGHARTWLDGAMLQASQAGGASRATNAVRLLVLHLGIKDAKTAPWLVASPDSIDVELLAELCEKHAVDFVFAGNWHDRRRWRLQNKRATEVLQLGALVPTGWDNPGLDGYGTLALLTEGGIDVVELPGPRFVKLQGKGEDVMALARARGHRLYASFDAQADELAELIAHADRWRASKDVAAAEVIPNKAAASTAAKQAAFAAKSAKTLDEALDNFIRRMPMPEHVNRAAVLELARGYMR